MMDKAKKEYEDLKREKFQKYLDFWIENGCDRDEAGANAMEDLDNWIINTQEARHERANTNQDSRS